jgi:hypothetical protein
MILITEPSAVAPDVKSQLRKYRSIKKSQRSVRVNYFAHVNSSIPRYRASFCMTLLTPD